MLARANDQIKASVYSGPRGPRIPLGIAVRLVSSISLIRIGTTPRILRDSGINLATKKKFTKANTEAA